MKIIVTKCSANEHNNINVNSLYTCKMSSICFSASSFEDLLLWYILTLQWDLQESFCYQVIYVFIYVFVTLMFKLIMTEAHCGQLQAKIEHTGCAFYVPTIHKSSVICCA